MMRWWEGLGLFVWKDISNAKLHKVVFTPAFDGVLAAEESAPHGVWHQEYLLKMSKISPERGDFNLDKVSPLSDGCSIVKSKETI